ncbi:RNA polymerase sigma factor [Parafrankia sp. FMc2]|uniref:RNA polymerase sigma factor n=1 Tax=Parafrankia sp. FMc2 TaxID=3233196 RepID=UPI0034D525E7
MMQKQSPRLTPEKRDLDAVSPPPTRSLPPDHAGPSDADQRLWDEILTQDVPGTALQTVEDQLFRYAWPIVLGWIRSGQILRHARLRGLHGVPEESAVLRGASNDDIEDLAQETIVRAVIRLRQTARSGNGWDPAGRASLASYFVGTCLVCFVDVLRSWSRQSARARPDRQTSILVGRSWVQSAADPCDVAVALDSVRRRLASGMLAERAAFLGAAGYTQTEIAEIVGTTRKAVESALARLRKKHTCD